MADKHALPSIDEDLAPRARLQLPKVAPRSVLEDETINANTADLTRSWAAVETVRLAETASAEPAKPETIFDSVRLNIPAYLNKALSRDAVEKDCTKTHLILQALANAGYEIDPDDMVADRRGGKKINT
jgi:hypothetical protein